MALYELHALVELRDPPAPEQYLSIKRIVRTYESKTRAELDLELLGEEALGKFYTIVTVQHLES